MKILPPSRVFRFAVWALALSSIHAPARSQETVAVAPWTESDSRLANHYIQLLQKDPSYGKVLDLLWDLYEKKNQTPLLLDYFKGASESGPSVARLIYAHLLRKGGDIEGSRPFYDQVLEAEPANLPAMKALAEIADQQKRWAKALSLYTRLAELAPAGDEEGLALRLRKAALHRLQGQTAEAVADWNALLKVFPDNVPLRTEIVGLLLEAGETKSAVAVLTELSKSGDPRRRLDSLLELNRLHEFTGDFEGAIGTARESMSLLHFKSPDYADLFSRLVRMYERFGRLVELEDGLAKATAETNPTERALYDLAEYYRLTADPVKEEAAVAGLAERIPGDPDHRVRLADIQLRNDRYEAAAATLDGLMGKETSVPLSLVLRRALVDLQAQGREAATARLTALLDAGSPGPEGRREILDFARTHYLDGLVERLLRDPSVIDRENSDESAAPIELARFLHERGRAAQAVTTLRDFAAAAEGTPLEKAARLHQIGVVFKDLGLEKEARAALDEAVALAPENLDYQSSRADLYVSGKEIDKAIAQLEAIREGRESMVDKAEIDQRLFSIIRGHFATKAEKDAGDLSVLKQGEIRSPADYRRLAEAASKAVSRSGDEPPPRELIDYYEAIKKTANNTPSTATRYRAAWWAFKLQDNQECFHQLTTANEEAGKPVVEIEKMLLNLAELNERPTFMVRHLTTLIEIDPDNADDYRQRRAEMRFELGFEDEAVRELKELAAKPDASLATLNTLAKLYQRQGSPGKQVEVWQRAYREADILEKRGIIKQLSTALIESGQPEEALKVQLDLLERETDPLQRRKQLDTQLMIAQSHFLLDWMRDRYTELAGRHPFDRFFPEALARVHRAAGQDREAYEAMKKAYYMSGRSEELLVELGALSDRLGDLTSAIYYRRQLLARGEGDTLENWKELVRMLEKDLDVGEADQLRRRLETKFGSNADFLAELTDHYLKTGSPRDAERTLSRLVSLRGWDLEARFRLGLLQSEREENEAAFATFDAILDETAELEYPGRFGERILPLIRVANDPEVARGAVGEGMESFVFTVEGYPFIGGNLQDEIADALQQSRDEFTPSPKDTHLIRLRSIEEGAALAAKLGRVPSWLVRWGGRDRPLFERLWATRYAGAGSVFAGLLAEYPDTASHTDQLFLAYCHLLAGDAKHFLAWVTEENPASGTQHSRSVYGAMAALILLKDNANDPLFRAEVIHESLSGMIVPKTVASHFFSELRKTGRYGDAYRIGNLFAETVMADEANFHFALSQVAGYAGRPADREKWLDRALGPETSATNPRVTNHFYAALTEKLALLDTDLERAEYLRRLGGSTSPASLDERNSLERSLLLALAAKNVDAVIDGLARIVAVQGRSTRPATANVQEVGHEQNQSWQRMSRLLHYYSDRIPLDAETSPRFVGALGGEPLLHPADSEVSSQFEQFEIDRNLLLLEWKNAPERETLVRELRGFLKEPDSRLELAKALETRGFHREAVPVYRDDAILRDRDYAPLQGLFDAASEALDPKPALEVISQINTREFPAPPGLTVDYLNDQHARFLLMDRDLERLTQLGRQPTARAEAPPVTSRTHLPYQDALVEAYRRIGDDDSLMRLLTDLRNRGGASGTQLLLGAETLAKASRHEEALEWLEALALDPSESTLQRRALLLAIDSHAALGWKDAAALRTLALASENHQPAAVTRRLAVALHEAGSSDEASGILRLLRRNTADAAQRTATSAELLRVERASGKTWADLGPDLEAFLHDFVYRVEPDDAARRSADGMIEARPEPVRPNAYRFVEWIVASGNNEGLGQSFAALSSLRANRWLGDLLVAHFHDRLDPEVRMILADLPGDAPERSMILETLPAFGPVGIALARSLVEESGEPGIAFFPNEPTRQIAFFDRIGDRNRLVEVHAGLVREAGSDFFHQSGLEDWVPTLDARRRLPLLLATIGETELAHSLFHTYDRALVSYQWNHAGFLNDYATFLIETEAYLDAEALLKRALQKSLRIDLRLLPRLYSAWGRTGEWEARTRDLHLTRGQEVLLRDWMSALAEGRELRETRNAW